MQANDGQDAARDFGGEKGLELAKLLKGNPEFDSHLGSVSEYMQEQNLGFVAVS